MNFFFCLLTALIFKLCCFSLSSQHHGYTMTLSQSTVLLLLLASVGCQGATTIHVPPTMTRQPRHEQLFQVSQTQGEPEKPFMLECVAEGNPEPVYRWTKNGEEFDYAAQNDRITLKPDSGTLLVSKPDDSDAGIYQCSAENEHGISVSNLVHLRKSELNSFPDESPKEVYVIEGEPLTLDCNPPPGYPKPTVFWMIQSSSGALQSINSPRITVDPDGDLHFSDVSQSDALDDARYACVASCIFRKEYKTGNVMLLRVEPSGSPERKNFPPTKQYTSPQDIVALRGNVLELSCIYGGTPVPEVKWSKTEGNLQSNRVTYTNYGKTLKIRKVDFQDEGTYQCTANNGVGSPFSQSMRVTVQAAPFWISVPNNTNAAEDETVSFGCVASGVPQPQVEWFINGVPIKDAEANPRRKLDSTAHELTIETLVKSDTAVFQCNASNIHGYAFRGFYLNVLALPPTITERPEPVAMAVVSSIVTLKCRVVGAPKPKVKWLKDEQDLKGCRFQVLENGDLEISDVCKHDEGDYTCYASNRFGDESALGRLEVKDKTKIDEPPENYEVAAGKSATFHCNAITDSSLELNFEWLFNGKPIDYDQEPRMLQGADNSLTITKSMEGDSGVYTCVAKTELDQDEASATLTVFDVPNPPRIVGVKCDELTALVEWEPFGDSRSPIISYTIQYNTSFTPDNWDDAINNIPAPDSHFKVSMTPWANYTFRVIAWNKIGPSLPSSHSDVCTTPEDVPYKNPDNVVGKGTEKDNLVISWTVMHLIEHNAPGFFYKVFWQREDIPSASWEVEEIHEWTQKILVISNQPTFKPYVIKVEAQNEEGQAHPAATEIIGYSGEDVPLEAPKNFELLNFKDGHSGIFKWDPVKQESVRGHFRGYKIQSWIGGKKAETLLEEVVQANVTEALISILRPYCWLVVRVLAFNDMFNGPPSNEIEFITPEGTPGPVASFDAVLLGSTGIYLIWTQPLKANGILTGYRIAYNEVQETALSDATEKKLKFSDPNQIRTKLAGLKPKTKYRITIRATTSKGEGAPYFVEVETNAQAERVPDEPDFIWKTLAEKEGKAGVMITWIPAVNGNPGTNFYVQYRRKGEHQWVSTYLECFEVFINIEGLQPESPYEIKLVVVEGCFNASSKIKEIVTQPPTYPEFQDHRFALTGWWIFLLCLSGVAVLMVIGMTVYLLKKWVCHILDNMGHRLLFS